MQILNGLTQKKSVSNQRISVLCYLILIMLSVAFLCGVVCGCGQNRISKAEQLIVLGSYSDAKKLMEEEISNHPKNYRAHFVLGKAYRENNEQDTAYEKFRIAIKADNNAKHPIREYLLKRNNRDWGDLNFVNEIMPELAKSDKDFAYSFYVESSSSYADAEKFTRAFPDDERAPSCLLKSARYHLDDGNEWRSKELFIKLKDSYPATEEGKEAKQQLANWWTKKNERLALDTKWHGFSIRKGQEYRYSISGSIPMYWGRAIVDRIEADDVFVFIGTKAQLNDWDSSRKLRFKAKSSDSGTAPRDGMIWFLVDTGGSEFTDSLSLTLERKEM